MAEIAERLKKIYYDPKHPAGYSTTPKLAQVTGIPRAKVEQWMRSQPTRTLHKPKRQRVNPLYPYRVYHSKVQYQADLVDYSMYAQYNRSWKYILMIMDIFSRKAWGFPLKTKSGAEVSRILKLFLDTHPVPERLQVDQGTEFYNRNVKKVLEDKNVELFSIFSPYKCAHVERLNRTIKNKLEKIFTATNGKNWVDYIDDVMDAYNNTVHSTTKVTPNNVDEHNEEEVAENILKRQRQQNPRKKVKILPVGTRVRISKEKGKFGRGYHANWSSEEFFIDQVLETPRGPPRYILRDHSGDIIKGSFYPQEVQPIERHEEIYQIDRVISQRHRRGHPPESLVHWDGYPASMNSYVPTSSIIQLKGIRQY